MTARRHLQNQDEILCQTFPMVLSILLTQPPQALGWGIVSPSARISDFSCRMTHEMMNCLGSVDETLGIGDGI